MHILHHAWRAGHADGQPTLPVVEKASPEESILGRGSRCFLTCVDGRGGAGFGVVVNNECAPADTTRLRLDQAQYGLYGDHRVGGVTAFLEDFSAGRGCERIGADHHFLLLGDCLGHVFCPGKWACQ